MSNEEFTKPYMLWQFGSECKDNDKAGRILRALCGQKCPLNDDDRLLLSMIVRDGAHFLESMDKRKKQYRDSKGKSKSAIPQIPQLPHDSTTSTTSTNSTPLTHSPTHSPTHPSTHSINRSVRVAHGTVKPDAIDAAIAANANANGTVDIGILLDRCKEFKQALDEDNTKSNAPFFAPEFDAAVICTAITDDYRSQRRWRQLVKILGEGVVRDECSALWSEIRSGEIPDNAAAALNARLTQLANDKGVGK